MRGFDASKDKGPNSPSPSKSHATRQHGLWSLPRRRILDQKLRNCEARAGQLQVEGSIDTGPRQSPTFWTRRCYVDDVTQKNVGQGWSHHLANTRRKSPYVSRASSTVDDVHVPELFSERCRNDACPETNHAAEWLVPRDEKCFMLRLANTPRRDIAIVLVGFWTPRPRNPSESDRGAGEGRTGASAMPDRKLGSVPRRTAFFFLLHEPFPGLR
ncbi:hypothetical protein B0J18DRAFT_247806 [Chaetomium sp. MPI-SDFR-AT-0129]|nr:hypothetical protein B0J18DRAFT_247806 [Chaetomium sp. MPI-SDFR-AT-0129]